MLRSESFFRENRGESLSHGQRFLTLLKTYKRIMSRPLLVRKVVICLAIASAVPVLGEAINPQGGEYAIIGTSPGDQSYSDAAIGSDGGYLVWQDNNASAFGSRIKAVQLGASLDAINAPFVVSSAASSKTAGNQEKPQVALLTGGGAV